MTIQRRVEQTRETAHENPTILSEPCDRWLGLQASYPTPYKLAQDAVPYKIGLRLLASGLVATVGEPDNLLDISTQTPNSCSSIQAEVPDKSRLVWNRQNNIFKSDCTYWLVADGGFRFSGRYPYSSGIIDRVSITVHATCLSICLRASAYSPRTTYT